MRGFALIIVFATCAGLMGIAHAEKAKTNQSTKVYVRPGEQSKVILKVKSGQGMTVLAKEGRWIKVRVQGRTGYVPRSKLDLPDDDTIARNTRRRPFVDGRSTSRGVGNGDSPDDRVGADAVGEGQDDTDTDKSSDDDEDKKPAAHAKKGGHDDEEDDDSDKKPAAHAKKGGDDEEDDDSDKKPVAHAKKGGDDEEDKSSDDEDTDKKPAAHAKKGGGDDEPKVSDDEDTDKPDERPVAHVTKKTKILAERDAGSEAQFTARPGDVLYPTETKGDWTMVENEEGDAGWVESSSLDRPRGGGGGDDEDEGGGGGGPRGPRTIELRGRFGVALLNQTMNTKGSTLTGMNKIPDTYTLGTSAYAVALGGEYLMPKGKKWLVGGELAYSIAKTAGGINYMGQANNFTVHDFNLRGEAGIDMKKKSGMMLLGRLGFHYGSFQVANYQNLAKNTIRLPQEITKAPTLGAALAIPRLGSKIGMRVSLDAMLFSSVTQTKNLQDGKSPSASGFCLGGMFNYRWKKQMNIQATYDLNYASLSFGAEDPTSMRGHTGTSSTRSDLSHTVTVGISYGL